MQYRSRTSHIFWVATATVTFIGVHAQAQTTQPASGLMQEEAVQKTETYNICETKECLGSWGGYRDELKDLGISISLSSQNHFQQNFKGGKDTHNAHRLTGTYDFVIKLDFEKMGLLPNTGFYMKAKGGYNESIRDKVGSSSAADPNSDPFRDYAVYVSKWWFWHKFWDDKAEVRLGVIETNKDLYDISLFANHEDKDFMNKLSVRNPTVPHKTGMGVNLLLKPTDWFYFQTGAFDAQGVKTHTQFDTAFHDEGWYVGLWEFGLTPEWASDKGKLPGRYRAGFWYNPKVQTIFRDTLDGARKTLHRGDDVGFYVGLDQMVWKENDDPKDKQGLGLFGRYGYAHKDVNKLNHYWQLGASYTGLIPERNKDVFGFSVAQGIYSKQYREEINRLADRETVYEWYYKVCIFPWLEISPDLQVITNPGGNKDARDAIVGGVRLRVLF